ncbi:MAG: hypothetical protein U9N04_00800 [Patescibacteria group bacterium]|nr:hypothetical protein [Patescibacteria group bacterium]
MFFWAESSATTEHPWSFGDGCSCAVGRGVIHSYANYGAYEIKVNQEPPVFVGIYPTGMSVLGELNWEIPKVKASSSEEGFLTGNAVDTSQISFWLADSDDLNPTLTVSAPEGEIVALKAMFLGNQTPLPATGMSLALTTSAGINNCDFEVPTEGNGATSCHKDWISLNLENPGKSVEIQFLEGTPPHCVEIRIATV